MRTSAGTGFNAYRAAIKDIRFIAYNYADMHLRLRIFWA